MRLGKFLGFRVTKVITKFCLISGTSDTLAPWRWIKLKIQLLAVLLAAITLGCTHEYIPEIEETWRIDTELSFIDPEFWPEGQQMRIGIFEGEDAKNPLASTIVNQPQENSINVSINEIPEGTFYLQLYLTEQGIYKTPIANIGEITVDSDVNKEIHDIVLLSYARVQNQVFNKCQLCHGGSSGETAANLNLTVSNSYTSLVNVTAEKNPSMIRVLPGYSSQSFLINVLNKEIDFDHAASSSATETDIQLVEDWINEGAKNN